MIAPFARENSGPPTLFSVYEPIESYLDAVGAARGGPADSMPLGAIDFFLLHQWIAQSPLRPRVIDLAAEATLGASTLFFLANSQVREVQVLPPVESAAAADWRPLLAAAVADRAVSPQPEYSVLPASGVGEIGGYFRGNELHPPLLVLLHAGDDPGEPLEDKLAELLSLQEDVVVAVGPLGRIGRCRALASLIAHCTLHPEHRLAAFRELCPFTANSQLAMVYRASHPHADEMLRRLGHWFDGNFQFLSLARELMGRHLAAESVDAKLAQVADFQQSESWQAFCKFQQVRQRFLPPGSRRDRLARAVWRGGSSRQACPVRPRPEVP